MLSMISVYMSGLAQSIAGSPQRSWWEIPTPHEIGEMNARPRDNKGDK